jgi:protein-ribulosamine 3-kinase
LTPSTPDADGADGANHSHHANHEGGIPGEVALVAAEILAPGGEPASLVARPISGGCIHPAVHLSSPDGGPGKGGPREGFLKWGPPDATSFPFEAAGLRALKRRGGVRVPEVLGVGDRWLLLEYLPPAPPTPDSGRRLGRGLARLHRPFRNDGGLGHPDAGGPGWSGDGWIGTLPQRNTGSHGIIEGPDGWPGFWRDFRLAPQMALAQGQLTTPVRHVLERLLDRVTEAAKGWEEDGISLLHGDLWSGNTLVTVGGEPALVDPAVYRGHREVDLAMMELFGGFAPEVFHAYRELRPLQPGYAELRRPLYQLYPLLVHLNLFGTGYLQGVEAAAKRVLGELG